MIEIKVTIDATPALLAVLTALTGGSAPASSNGSAAKSTAKKTIETAAGPVEVNEGIKLEDLRALVKSTADGGKKEEVKSLLAEYGVKSVSTLPAEKYNEFNEKVKAL